MNNPNGIYQVCYYLGIGVEIDMYKAFMYYLRSAETEKSRPDYSQLNLEELLLVAKVEIKDQRGDSITNVIGKTWDNFLNELSIKYFFNKVLALNSKKISLKEVENFQTTSAESINICFSINLFRG
ncbi:hypothetical protein C2G38_2232120 [Gigaspora rosea]|uniref:Uncharacterized protein n=1 Tax=Gigaspora rosea TaxID=44941 RepID=A0A397TS87_9GLOM|nr:hypothetical protein C2G38_2232120 [Gigaspora rosea]